VQLSATIQDADAPANGARAAAADRATAGPALAVKQV